jgi:LysM repeat protein
MTERRQNPIARIVAVVALITVFMLVAFTIATSGGDSGDGDGGGGNGDQVTNEPTKQGERALDKGFYVVEEGDTLAQIASDTGLELDELTELNPQLDPQALQAGDKVRLR